jgi:hypothetical protein
MRNRYGFKSRLTTVLSNAVLVVLGVGAALGLTELLLRWQPDLIPRGVRVSPPVRRYQAFDDNTYEVSLSDGDLFHWMRGKIQPLSPDRDEVVASVRFTTDAHGFRNAPPERPTYDVVALGDSFTMAANVASPWPQQLAETAGRHVLNLGEAGAGPQQELAILRKYGLSKQPLWVIMAYFEGNDLYDAGSYARASPLIITRVAWYFVTRAEAAQPTSSEESNEDFASHSYLYPMTLTINGAELEIGFFSAYFAWATVSEDTIRQSRNYELVCETILDALELSEAAEAQFLLVYVPSKESVYLPLLDEKASLARVLGDVSMLELDSARFIQFAPQPVSVELARHNTGAQASLLGEFAADHDIAFLDLSPTFQATAGAGAQLYYPYDTHWNQSGHDLAAETIAAYLEAATPDVTIRQR